MDVDVAKQAVKIVGKIEQLERDVDEVTRLKNLYSEENEKINYLEIRLIKDSDFFYRGIINSPCIEEILLTVQNDLIRQVERQMKFLEEI